MSNLKIPLYHCKLEILPKNLGSLAKVITNFFTVNCKFKFKIWDFRLPFSLKMYYLFLLLKSSETKLTEAQSLKNLFSMLCEDNLLIFI